MADNEFPSHQLSERREQPPAVAPHLVPVITRSACSSRSDFARPSLDDTDYTPNLRKTWPNGSSRIRWFHYERLMGRSRDPQVAIEKLWRKHEKRLRRAQIESNEDAPVNLTKD
ncbi:hypothetical protein POM88_007215 [Heracleum sosnowskyi]|uniref:Uncharacterized protein n=1 Tax=Heracleum sosnowskyi TaxID=360622 RepID=A0AAD8N620_9APIA|nr:hypothetical protein POM88_007215 [Heracleum sosnowskyi]